MSCERVNLQVTSLPGSNKPGTSYVVRYVNWVFWLIVGWLAVSVAVAIVFGRVIRARDKRETPPSLHQDDEQWRDAG